MAMTDRLSVSGDEASRTSGAVQGWLWCCAALVFAMVVVGGATRLTEAGLSITEWKLVSGIVPPLNDAQWQSEFAKYKQIPQYSQLFPTMDLGWFKFIYFFEWGHRLLGRSVGAAFALPLVFFWVTGKLTSRMKPQLLLLLALGGLQGVVGWWMVKSGLSDRVEVSQYRLALHLLLASLTYGWLVWLATGLGRRAPAPAATAVRSASILLVLVVLQIGLGALVAGLRAGQAYNTWPLMDGRLVPPLGELLQLSPLWINTFENIATVQLQHRLTAYLLLVAAWFHAFAAKRSGDRLAAEAGAIAALATLQAAIGIVTLLLVVPLWAALLHQATAMLLLGAVVAHRRRCAGSAKGSRPEPGWKWPPAEAARAPSGA